MKKILYGWIDDTESLAVFTDSDVCYVAIITEKGVSLEEIREKVNKRYKALSVESGEDK